MNTSRRITLSIVIINWNSADYVLKCLESIYAQTSEVEYEVIVIDNASFDGCDKRLLHDYPQVYFFQSQRNLGFAKANNLGATLARGGVLLFLNPDTEIKNGAIEQLYHSYQKIPDAGAVGCRLLNTDGSLQTSCIQSLPSILNQFLDADILRRWFPNSRLWGVHALYDKSKEPAEVEAVSGACMMIRKEVFDKVGGFSRDYFMYGEDMDLCYKTRKNCYKNYYISNAVIVHHGGGSSQSKLSKFSVVMMRESVKRFLKKSRGSWYGFGYQLALCSASFIRLSLMLFMFPIYHIHGRRPAVWVESFAKWFAIWRWSLGLEKWVDDYGPIHQEERCSGTGKI
jgi:GT2 family glycosyltransferase